VWGISKCATIPCYIQAQNKHNIMLAAYKYTIPGKAVCDNYID